MEENGIETGETLRMEPAAMGYEPSNPDHAVTSVQFAFGLTQPVKDAEISALLRSHDQVKSELPAVSRPDPFEPSVEFAYRRPDGTATWLVRVAEREVVVECTRYTRWTKVWETAKRFLWWAAQPSAQTAQLGHLILRVTDQFLSDDPESSVDQLLKHSPFIAPMAFNVKGKPWHCHVGWFDDLDAGQILHNLNIDSRKRGSGSTSGEGTGFSVSINHWQQCRLAPALSLVSGSDACVAEIESVMQSMHGANKRVVRDLLVEALQRQIGLTAVE